MKTLHINQHLEWAGGVETYLLSIIPSLEALGHEQVVVYAEGREELVRHSRRVLALAAGTRAAEKQGHGAMTKILDEEQPDLVHLHQVYNTGAIQACLQRVPVVVHAHDYRYVCPASTFYYKRTHEVCGRTAGPACFSTTLRKHCLNTPAQPRPRLLPTRPLVRPANEGHRGGGRTQRGRGTALPGSRISGKQDSRAALLLPDRGCGTTPQPAEDAYRSVHRSYPPQQGGWTPWLRRSANCPARGGW